MLGSLLDTIDKKAIDQLVANGVSEGQRLDYKERLPGGAPRDKKEFLADVSAFANTSGGDLVFGIVERRDANGKPTGIPEHARGVGAINGDAEFLRLESIIQDGIAPRVPVKMTAVDGFADGPVVIVRVPRTTTGPHMVVFERHNRFYGRANRGKYLLDVDDLRSAFNATSDAVERAFRFRDSRIAAVVSGDTPVKTNGAALLVLVMPEHTVSGGSRLDPRSVPKERIPIPLSGGGGSIGYVAEGAVFRTDDGYSLVMRNGAIESVYGFCGLRDRNHWMVPSGKVEREVVRFVRDSLALLDRLNFSPPFQVFAAFIGVRDFPLAAPAEIGGSAYYERRFDRELLTLPDVAFPTVDQTEVATRLRPMFEGMWQALGDEADPYYESGASAKW